MRDYLYTAEPETEDPRACWKRRLQQRRCLVCGSRQLVNNQTSYFCRAHIGTHKYCSTCETLRTIDAHGKCSRCKGCASTHALAYYHRNSDRNIYRIRLRDMAKRQHTRADQIFASVRRRIALADLVAATPGWSWPRRAALIGGNAQALASAYRAQLRGMARDPDQVDTARANWWEERDGE